MSVGIDEARLDAIYGMLEDEIATLSTSLTTSGAPLEGTTITADCLFIGHPKSLPKELPVIVCVVGGDEEDAFDLESERLFIGQAIPKYNLKTSVYVYVNPDALKKGLATKQESDARERALSRLCDWVYGTIHTYANLDVELDSTICSPPENDHLSQILVESTYKGILARGFDGSLRIPGARLTITGWVA